MCEFPNLLVASCREVYEAVTIYSEACGSAKLVSDGLLAVSTALATGLGMCRTQDDRNHDAFTFLRVEGEAPAKPTNSSPPFSFSAEKMSTARQEPRPPDS